MKTSSNDFLISSKYCDFKTASVYKKARNITGGSKDDRERAVALFYWVRDNILYRVGMWQRTASATLQEGEGTCTNKSNLLVAFLRANGIPAGYGVMKVLGQQYFGPIALPILRSMVSKYSVHIYTVVYLGGKWIKCDPSDDIVLSSNTAHFNSTTALIDWDGKNDAILNLDKKHVIKDEYPFYSIDHIINKKSKRGRGIAVKVGNIFINYLRNNKFNNIDDLNDSFIVYLKKHYSLYYYFIIVFGNFFKIIDKGKKYEKFIE